MGDEQGERSTPLSPIGLMDMASREGVVVTSRFPKIEGLRGILVEQWAKYQAELC